MPNIRWGILGTGYVAQQFATGLKSVSGAELYTVASRTKTKAQTFAQKFQVPHPCASYEELAANSNVDVVYIATPPAVHADNSKLCLNAGKSVLCEKPFTVNAQEAQEVIELAREKGLFCMEAMWTRFIPLVKRLKDLLASGEIGEICLVNIEFGLPVAANSNLLKPEVGGGALLDRGIYGLSLASFLLGEPDKVDSQFSIGPSGVDEQAVLMLQYDKGAIVTISASLKTYSSNEMVIMGTHGKIRVHEPFCFPSQLSISPHTPSEAIASSPSSESLGASPSLKEQISQNRLLKRLLLKVKPFILPFMRGTTSITDVCVGNGYNYEAVEVMHCLQQGHLESGVMPLDETLRIMQIVDRIRHHS